MFTCSEWVQHFVKICGVRKFLKSKIVFIDKQYKYFKGSININYTAECFRRTGGKLQFYDLYKNGKIYETYYIFRLFSCLQTTNNRSHHTGEDWFFNDGSKIKQEFTLRAN